MASIYMLGDSHTQALGPRLARSLSDHDFTYEAFPGHSTERAWSKAKLGSDRDVIVLALGGNDFGNRGSTRRNLVRFLRARSPNAKILWFGPAHAVEPNVGVRHHLQANDQRIQMPQLGVKWHDSRPWTKRGHRDDGVHFTGSAYTKWADKIASPVRHAADAVARDPGLTAIGVVATALA
ncbi:MAG: SGNH/GDSL hydrolase family protein, partial [Dehalococcoidia bacterium]